jgi:hypothetical protein
VLATSSDPTSPGTPSWFGDELYLGDVDCTCNGRTCDWGVACSLAIGHPSFCPPAILPVVSGESFTYSSLGINYVSRFVPAPDGFFWATYGVAPGLTHYDSTIERKRLGDPGFVTARGSSAGNERRFSALSSRAGRLYWVESDLACPASEPGPPGCPVTVARIVSADATLTTIPDEALTVHFPVAGAAAPPATVDLKGIVHLQVDD